MNKKLNPNFSLKKLLLSALVAGPLAILPAPLWALPSTAATNLTTSSTSITYSGVLDGVANGALNITAPDKSILTWQSFNIASNDTINYLLPSTTASVLNNVAGGAASTIAGAINSNGNVYLLNPAGIVISQTAAINTGGFYASTVAEPSSFFTTTGTLNFTGSATTDVVLKSDGSASPTIQALGTGNKIILAGRSVLVEGATLYGNVTLQSASTGKVNLAQTSTPTLNPDLTVATVNLNQAGGAVNILQAAGSGGNLTIVSNGGTVSLSGTPVAVNDGTANNLPGALVTVQTDGTLALSGGLGGSGYAPNSSIALSISAPTVRQSLNSTTTANVNGGTTAIGTAQTGPTGAITGYTLTNTGVGYGAGPGVNSFVIANGGSGYTSAPTVTLTSVGGAGTGATATASIANGVVTGFSITNPGVGYTTPPTVSFTGGGGTLAAATATAQFSATAPQVGFVTNVTGALSVNTTGTTNGAVTQSGSNDYSRLTVTGATTITTGTSGTAADVTLSNALLSTLNLPLVGTVNINEQDGFTLGNAKVLPNAANALTLRARAGNISMSGSSKVEIVPSVLVPVPNTLLTANAGGVTYSNVGDLRVTTLSTTTASAGVTSLTATGNVTVTPTFSSPSLTITTTGGNITTGNLSSTSGASNQVSATLTASGNVSVSSVNTSGKLIIKSGGALTLNHANNGFMTTGAGLDLSAVGDITMANTAALATSGTDAKIVSSAGSVILKGGFSGGGAITAANDITIGAPSTTGKPSVTPSVVLDTSSILWKASGGTTSNPGGLYTPNSQVPMTVSVTAAGTNVNVPAAAPTGANIATGFFTTNAAGQINGTVITNSGAGYGYTVGNGVTTDNGVNLININYTANAAPTNSVVANSALALTATAGTVAVTNAIVGTGSVSIKSGGALTVPSITSPTLSLESTTASVVQNPATSIVSSVATTLKAATSVSLDLAGNDFNSVVVNASPSGVTLRDANALTLGNGTDATGNVTVTSGAGLTALVGGLITLPSPNVAITAGVANIAAGSVTGLTLTTTGTGYAPSRTDIPVTFTAPPVGSPANFPVVPNAQASTAQNVAGFVLGSVGGTANKLQAVVLPNAVGFGFQPGAEIPLTVTGTFGTAPTANGIVNANGQISAVRITSPGVNVTAITSINTGAAVTTAGTTATGNLVTNAAGQVTSVTITNGGDGYFGGYSPSLVPAAIPVPATGITGTFTPALTGAAVTSAAFTAAGQGYITAPVVAATATTPAYTTTLNAVGGIATVTPIATGGVALGAASTDVIKVAGNLTLSSVGPAGTVPANGITLLAKYSELTTVAANVAIVGNVSLNTLGANATFGVATGGFGAAPAVTAAAVGGTAGTFTVTQNNSVNLGATTATSLIAKSAAGDITNSGKLAITGASEFTAGSLFAPAVITLNDATNVFGGTVSIINGKNVSVVGATAVTVGSAAQNGVVSGSISVESAGALTLITAGNGNLGVVGFKAGGAVVINDGTNTDGLTLQNISNTGTGAVGVTAAGPITLGSGIKLASTGTTTITSTGAAASIKDSAPGISIINALTLRSDNDIAITNTGHSIGRVVMTSGLGAAASTNANITYQEGGSANLGAVTITAGAATPGSLSVTSTGGSIFQGAGTITVPAQTTTSTNTAIFTALAGEVTLDRTGNSLASPVSISAAGNSTVRQSTGNLVLGNVAVTAGTFAALVHAPVVTGAATVTGAGVAYTAVPTVTVGGGGTGAVATATLSGGTTGTVTAVAITAAGSGYSTPTLSFSTSGSTTAAVATTLGTVASELQQAIGTTVRVFGDTTLSSVGKITLDNVGNNFGGLTIASNLGGSALATAPGAAVVLREGGTINLKAVNTGTGGLPATATSTLKLTSEGGSIVSSPTALLAKTIIVGGSTTLVSAADVTLNTTDVANNFGGQSITVTAPGNVSIQDNNATTVIAGGSTIGGTLTIKNDNAAGIIKDSPGELTVNGNVFLQTSATGSINIGASTAKLGAVQFRSGGVSIAEATTLNLAAGSTSAAGSVVQLSSNGDIVTSGLGGGSFGGTLSLNANGSITVSNPIFVAQGLTFRALGAVNLSALSQTGNLSGLAPTNLGAASYVAPSP